MQKEDQSVNSVDTDNERSAPDSLPVSEDTALAELKNRDLSVRQIEQLAKDATAMKSRKVRIAVAAHPRTPRRIALRVLRELYTFDLMRFALTPSVAADLKHVADELLVGRLASIGLGERISLARGASQMVAAALLLDKEKQVWEPALENPRMSEAGIVKALHRETAAPAFVQGICRHTKWSSRPEIRVALLRNTHTPLARALEFAREIPAHQLRDILHTSQLPEETKEYLGKSSKSSNIE
jgi:hypothetical protein